MAEFVGAIASILTLCHALSEGVSHVIELYRAPAEIRSLQEQVQIFRSFVQAVEVTPIVSAPSILRSELLRAREIIEELHQVIAVKLVRQGHSSDRISRRAWLRYKQRITRLHGNLQDARETLSGALCVDIMSSTRRVESTATTLSLQSTSIHLTALAIDQRLEEIQSALKPRRSLRSTRPTSSTVYPGQGAAASYVLQPSMGSFGHCLEASTPNDNDNDNENAVNAEENTSPLPFLGLGTHAVSLDDPLLQRADPAGPLERSAFFRPETYTVRDSSPTLFGYYDREITATEYARVNQYAMFYSNAPRQWMRLMVSVTVSIESKYWNIERAITVNHDTKGRNDLTPSVKLMLERYLTPNENVKQDSHLSLYLGNHSDSATGGEHNPLVKFIKPCFPVKTYLREITSMIHHLNCPRFWTRQLIQRPLHHHSPENTFLAFLQSRWVLQTRFGSHKARIDSNLYTLQVLHCLQGAPGICPFVGVVLDDDTGMVNSFLCEMPMWYMFQLIRESNRSGQPVSWERRWKWCKQVVQGVAALHSKGFLAGALAHSPEGMVGVDANGDAVLYRRFQTIFTYDEVQAGVVPPEHRTSAQGTGSMKAVPSTDIYQLGHLLWRIATDNLGVPRSEFCRIAGCTTKADQACSELHADPVQLPLHEQTPQYLREVITACRAEDPDKRPPAWKLLEIFPSMAETSAQSKGKVGADVQISSPETPTRSRSPAQRTSNAFVRLEGFAARFFRSVTCDICGKPTNEHNFHCRVCAGGDYYICPQCFLIGNHCLEDDHYLLEFTKSEEMIEQRYFSKVKETGHRDVIAL